MTRCLFNDQGQIVIREGSCNSEGEEIPEFDADPAAIFADPDGSEFTLADGREGQDLISDSSPSCESARYALSLFSGDGPLEVSDDSRLGRQIDQCRADEAARLSHARLQARLEELERTPDARSRLEILPQLVTNITEAMHRLDPRSDSFAEQDALLDRAMDLWSRSITAEGVPIDQAVLQMVGLLATAHDMVRPRFTGSDGRELAGHFYHELQTRAEGSEEVGERLVYRLLAHRLAAAASENLRNFDEISVEDSRDALLEEVSQMEARIEESENGLQRLDRLQAVLMAYQGLEDQEQVEGTRDRIVQTACRPDVPLEVREELIRQLMEAGDEAGSRTILEGLSNYVPQLMEQVEAAETPEERLRLLDQVLEIHLRHGTEEEIGGIVERIRRELRNVAAHLDDITDLEEWRSLNVLLFEQYSIIGETDRAERCVNLLLAAVRADTVSSEADRAHWYATIAGLHQQTAEQEALRNQTAPDLSGFRDVMGELASFSEDHGLTVENHYSRFMLSVAEGRSSQAREEFEALAVATDEDNEYLLAAQPVWRAYQRMETARSSGPTIQWLSLAIEGHYDRLLASSTSISESCAAGSGLAEAEENERPADEIAVIRREREEIREGLQTIVSYLQDGRAASTQEAIRLLERDLGEQVGVRFRAVLSRINPALFDLIRTEDWEPNVRMERLRDIALNLMRDGSARTNANSAVYGNFIQDGSARPELNAVVYSIFSYIAESGYGGLGPRPIRECLENIIDDRASMSDLFDLIDRVEGDQTLRERIETEGAVMPYYQAAMQVAAETFTLEGSLLLAASLATGNIGGSLAFAGTMARFGYLAAETAPLGVRLFAAGSSFTANWSAFNAVNLGGGALIRLGRGEAQMTPAQIQTSLASSFVAFGAIGAAGSVTGRVSHNLAMRYLSVVGGMTAGEEINTTLGITPEDGSALGVRIFRNAVAGIPLEAMGAGARRVSTHAMGRMEAASQARAQARFEAGMREALGLPEPSSRARRAWDASADFARQVAVAPAGLFLGVGGGGGPSALPRESNQRLRLGVSEPFLLEDGESITMVLGSQANGTSSLRVVLQRSGANFSLRQEGGRSIDLNGPGTFTVGIRSDQNLRLDRGNSIGIGASHLSVEILSEGRIRIVQHPDNMGTSLTGVLRRPAEAPREGFLSGVWRLFGRRRANADQGGGEAATPPETDAHDLSARYFPYVPPDVTRPRIESLTREVAAADSFDRLMEVLYRSPVPMMTPLLRAVSGFRRNPGEDRLADIPEDFGLRQRVGELFPVFSPEVAMGSISRAIDFLGRPNGRGWERPVVSPATVEAEIVRMRAQARLLEGMLGRELEAQRMTSEANRLAALNSQQGVPGAMLDIQLNGREAVIVGDLHGNEAGLDLILNSRDASGSTLLQRVRSGRAVLIFVGDAIHPAEDPLDAMDPSIRTLDRIVHLQAEHPEAVFYTQGNHDVVCGAGEGRFVKGWVAQGAVFRDELMNQGGLGYTRSVQNYFDSVPLIVRIMQGREVVAIAGHSPIVRGGLTPEQATEARIGLSPGNLAQSGNQLTWNRPGDDYTDADVALMRASLGSERTVFVSGHTPDSVSAWQPGDGQVILQAVTEYNGNLSVVRVSPQARVEVVALTGTSRLVGVDLAAQIAPATPHSRPARPRRMN